MNGWIWFIVCWVCLFGGGIAGFLMGLKTGEGNINASYARNKKLAEDNYRLRNEMITLLNEKLEQS